MTNIIPFRRRQRPTIPDTRARIEGALALALDAVDQLVAVLDDLDEDPDLNDGDTGPSLDTPEIFASHIIWLRKNDRD